MDEEQVLALLRNKLKVEVDFKKSCAYWDSSGFFVRILLDGEAISESQVMVPDWEEKRSEY